MVRYLFYTTGDLTYQSPLVYNHYIKFMSQLTCKILFTEL